MKNQIKYLEKLLERLQEGEKLAILEQEPVVKSYLKHHSWVRKLLPEQRYLVLCIVVIEQEHALCKDVPDSFLRILREIEQFYDTIGGIIGYHLMFLRLFSNKKRGHLGKKYLKPEWINIEKENKAVQKAIKSGLEHLPLQAEIYPVGGAGDRLALICDIEQEPLPAAQLEFGGRMLLEGLFRDLQAREYLYYKLFKKRITVPVALMTSNDKRNHYRISLILEQNNYFSRPRESVRLFSQPLVPMVTKECKWAMKKPGHPHLRPGGHGVVWKLALDHGIFDWFKKLKKTKGLVRQINNPIAGIDYGLLAFTGIGFLGDKKFGFASCPRLPNTAEGTDILIEQKKDKEYQYTISNVEYTDFVEKGIADKPASPHTPYSAYPSNTNILFFDIQAIRRAVEECPIPGMLINMKNRVICSDGKETIAGRLESTMQNISDVITTTSFKKLGPKALKNMGVYITYNKRRKTLSVAKNAFNPEKPLLGTPQGCLYEMMENMYELMKQCKIKLPPLCSKQVYLEQGPNFFILLHPALGPLFSIIAQKISGGKIASNSDMILEIAELEIKNIDLNGSLLIDADEVMGEKCGKCILSNVKIRNEGIDRSTNNEFWKNQVSRKEALSIKLQGNSEFIAENICFEGNFDLVVPDGHRMRATKQGFKLEPLRKSWKWNYKFLGDKIILSQTFL